jgi:hypothetical protein
VSDLDAAEHATDPFLRQLEVFDSWDRIGVGAERMQDRLSDSRVLIIGAGGVGTVLATLLVSCGIGTIVVADHDRVERHNLARQFLFGPNDVGESKAEILASRLTSRGLSGVVGLPFMVTSDTVDEIVRDFGPFDVATGWPPPMIDSTRAVVRRLVAGGTPFMCVGEHDAGPLIEAEEDIQEHAEWASRRFEIFDVWTEVRQLRRDDARHPSFAPTIASASALAVDEIVRLLTGFGPLRTRRGVFSIDPISSQTKLMSR